MMSQTAPVIESAVPNSPGLWRLAWRRLCRDKLAMFALGVVGLYILTLLLSSSGLLAADWNREIAVNYAPPTFAAGRVEQQDLSPDAKRQGELPPENPLDPLKEVLRRLRAQSGNGAARGDNEYGVADPLAKDLEAIRAEMGKDANAAGESDTMARRATLPFGADKWGHDIIKKTIKGSETSIVVGLAAALLATSLGTLFGALAGYFGRAVDDFFNWFYSVFTAVPNLLLIMAIAAVLQRKGVTTIVLILALTGWTGTFRLMRAEYMKHKAREYVL
ncbi:MAG TPA: ABC transporter permease subunit, partial [Burkholderiaceae bacterium]